jgi:DNA-binding NtrC family response regulator
LIETFITKYEREYGKSNISLTPKALEILLRHDWPGNVRELENIIQRLIVLCDHEIDVDLIPNQMKYREPSESFSLKPLHEIEKAYILKVLSMVNNNKTKAAEILQIDRKTLRQKLL